VDSDAVSDVTVDTSTVVVLAACSVEGVSDIVVDTIPSVGTSDSSTGNASGVPLGSAIVVESASCSASDVTTDMTIAAGLVGSSVGNNSGATVVTAIVVGLANCSTGVASDMVVEMMKVGKSAA
jgi:hypothetical protein